MFSNIFFSAFFHQPPTKCARKKRNKNKNGGPTSQAGRQAARQLGKQAEAEAFTPRQKEKQDKIKNGFDAHRLPGGAYLLLSSYLYILVSESEPQQGKAATATKVACSRLSYIFF